MRVLTWNINGVRTLPQYHPWNTLKTFDDILNHLEADVLCFQEVKSSRQGLPKPVAVPPSFDSFFSFPLRKTGYSGIAIYTRKTAVVPLKSEEGLTGLIQPKPPLSPSERISQLGTYPPDFEYPTVADDEDEVDYKDLDSEGRAVVVDLGLFVLISVYCPNDGTGTEERGKFKMNYQRLLEARVDGLIKAGREVMVVGDLNACVSVHDHCEGQLMVDRGLAEGLEGEEGFWGLDSRRWIRDWLVHDDGREGGRMIDIVRKFWPDRKGMYTCWNTKISARETNYGTRIDFILVTPGLVPWVKAADIQPQIKGSDHCPVYVDLWDEITQSDGTIVKLSSVLGAQPNEDGPAEPPRLAAKFWDEYKQKLLSTFFGKERKTTEASYEGKKTTTTSINSTSSLASSQSFDDCISPSISPSIPTSSGPPPRIPPSQSAISQPFESSPSSSPPLIAASGEMTTGKRKLVPGSPKASSSKKTKLSQPTKGQQKLKADQSTIFSFFQPPKLANSKNSKSTSKGNTSKSTPINGTTPSVSELPSANEVELELVEVDEDADYRFALSLSQAQQGDSMPSSSHGLYGASGPEANRESKQAQWSTLLAPTPAPKCIVHQEPTKQFTVNKPGPNKGKKFFICSRPVGPGYDKGRSERPREQVDPQWKCDFFKWSSDARKEMTRNGAV